MTQLQEKSSYRFHENLDKRYSEIENGYCMLADAANKHSRSSNCRGKVGKRHSISRLHLKLITGGGRDSDHIYATNENRTFFKHKNYDKHLRRTSIKEFSAGKWACQEHDDTFKSLDENLIDLSKPENLFKIVCRVVFRHNLLMRLRWIPVWECIQTNSGWEQFKKNALIQSVRDEEVDGELREWRDAANTVNTMAEDLSRNLLEGNWDFLQIRACMLKSKPTVAGWGCLFRKFDLRGLDNRDLRKDGWKDHLSLGYIIVIPQEYGHAIVTACASSEQFRVEGITGIHRMIPYDVTFVEPYVADEKMKKFISNWVWGLNELGIKPSLYNNWNDKEKAKVNQWLSLDDREKKSVWVDGPGPPELPMLF